MALGINLGILAQETSTDFQNIYSLDFDGVDDYVDCGDLSQLGGETEITISMWMRSTSSANKILLDFKEGASRIAIQRYTNNIIYLYVNNVGVDYSITTLLNNWYNIVYVFNGSGATDADRLKLYVNGIEIIASSFSGTVPTSIGTFTSAMDSKIGSLYNNSFGFRGNIDEVSVFNSVIPIGDLWDANGKPTDLTSLNPLAWYRMGDNGAYKSPQWLIPSNENNGKVSNYSFAFDGLDDYIDLPSSVDLGINSTISAWVKRSDILNLDSITGESSYSSGVGIYITGQQRVYMKIGSLITFWYNVSGFGILNQVDTWFHLAIVRQGNDATLYLNGSPTYVKSGWGTSITTKFDRIGAFALTGNNPMFGNLDEIAGFDSALTDLQINDIYNGGTPTTISGAVAHWRMGEDATFSGGVWTVPDSVGSNNGTSNAMDIEDRVGDAPSSENNALSYNMDLVDRVTDVPT